MSGDLRTDLTELCAGRDLSAGAATELDRLLSAGADHELVDAIDHLRHLPARPAELNTCPATTGRFVTLHAAARARRRDHRDHIVRAATRMAHDVVAYRLTLVDADTRLDQLCEKRDSAFADLAAIRLIPWAEAAELAASTFRSALASAERERRLAWAS